MRGMAPLMWSFPDVTNCAREVKGSSLKTVPVSIRWGELSAIVCQSRVTPSLVNKAKSAMLILFLGSLYWNAVRLSTSQLPVVCTALVRETCCRTWFMRAAPFTCCGRRRHDATFPCPVSRIHFKRVFCFPCPFLIRGFFVLSRQLVCLLCSECTTTAAQLMPAGKRLDRWRRLRAARKVCPMTCFRLPSRPKAGQIAMVTLNNWHYSVVIPAEGWAL